MDHSISEYFYKAGGPKGHRCGYCGSKDTNVSNGMWTHYLTCEDYQGLINRGWRRCGKYCYKPVMDRTCCPLYTIRCEATRFRVSKSQKKVLKKANEFLVNGERTKSPAGTSEQQASRSTVEKDISSDSRRSNPKEPTVKAPKTFRPGGGTDPDKPPCMKAKVLRREQKLKKLAAREGMETPGGERQPSSTAEGTTDQSARGKSPEAAAQEVAPSFLEIGPDGKKPLEMFLSLPASDKPLAHKLNMKFIRSSPPSPEFKTTFKESYALYKKYQMSVHHDSEDECDEEQFQRFLCESPLIPKEGPGEWPCGYGSYHQQYFMDGKLIMVGVIDILPNCLSSVYVYYDPDYAFLTPGVYSALREMEMTRALYCHNPEFKFYYMGYYVHKCQKMRYKRNYYPSYLLCPESYNFTPIEPCLPKLDVRTYSRLNEQETAPEVVESWLDNTLVLFQRQKMPYAIFKALCGSTHDVKVKEYASFVGPEVASRMLLFLNADIDW